MSLPTQPLTPLTTPLDSSALVFGLSEQVLSVNPDFFDVSIDFLDEIFFCDARVFCAGLPR